MSNEKSSHLTASRLRLLLVASIVVVAAIICIGFYFLQSYLYNFAVNVSHANEDAAVSSSDIDTWGKLKQRLDAEQTTIERTKNIVADSEKYQYQEEIISDLNTYAARSGVGITTFGFASSGSTPGAASTATSTVSAVQTISGLKATSVSVTLATPTKYTNLMRFIHSIETNLTKMQIASVALTKGTTPDDVSIDTLNIEVYIK